MSWVHRVNGKVLERLLVVIVVVPPAAAVAIDREITRARSWVSLAAVLGVCLALVLSHKLPLLACVLAAPPIIALQNWGMPQLNGPETGGVLIVVFVLGVRLGATPLWSCVIGVAALGVGLQLFQVFNPLSIMLTVGPCAIGMVLASRHRLATRLAERAEDLSRERSRYAEEAVRYERARIARELHDIVAHCVSLIVVQAGAGQRMSGDPIAELDTFDNIASAVSQAQAEIDLLVELLASSPSKSAVAESGTDLIHELVERARATGMTVALTVSSDSDEIAAAVGELIYRVVQEGLTNALKHAPGSTVAVSVICSSDDGCTVRIHNGPGLTTSTWPSLGGAGGGFGLTGMRERVVTLGGELISGPTADNGWLVTAVLPAGPRTTRSLEEDTSSRSVGE